MAYVNQASTARRPGTILAVGAIHALLGYGLIVGLAGGVFTDIIDKNPGAIFIPDTPPPPPPPTEPEPKPDVKTLPQTAPDPYIPPTPNALPRDNAPVIISSNIIVPKSDVVLTTAAIRPRVSAQGYPQACPEIYAGSC